MTQSPGFAVPLRRLLAQRRTDLTAVAHAAGVPVPELDAVLAAGDAASGQNVVMR